MSDDDIRSDVSASDLAGGGVVESDDYAAKQLTSLKNLLQSQELLMNNSVLPGDNVSILNQSAMINSSLQ